jgi:hypothetical protein
METKLLQILSKPQKGISNLEKKRFDVAFVDAILFMLL